MRKKVMAVVALAGLLGLIGGAFVANAGTDITAPETIKVTGTTTKDKFVDLGKKGPSTGDTNAFTETLTTDAGATVGTGRIQCVLQVGHWAICTGTFNITNRGEIVGEGMVNIGQESPDLIVVPITGGSGDFSNVRGEAHVQQTGESTETITFELLP